MIMIYFMDFEGLLRSRVLLWVASLTLIWLIWWERNARVFEDVELFGYSMEYSFFLLLFGFLPLKPLRACL